MPIDRNGDEAPSLPSGREETMSDFIDKLEPSSANAG